MPTSLFNLGQDGRAVLIGGFTGQLALPLVTSFRSMQSTKTIRVDPLNQAPIEFHAPGGWTFSFSIDRASASLDSAIAALELAYWQGQVIQFGALYFYVEEVNGSTTTWQYNQVTFHESEAGTWTQNQTVKQGLAGFASTRYQI
jgi:hypothetical protein